MNVLFEITIPGNPVPKGRPRFRVITSKAGKNYATAYTDTRTKSAEATIGTKVLEKMHSTQLQTLQIDAVAVVLTYYMPIPTSTPKYKREIWAKEYTPHVKKPDLDNLIKLTLDAICGKGLILEDDSCVANIKAWKVYSLNPRTEIAIVGVEEDATTNNIH
ncbi:MAG: RusA family crossover junction endodeoxyribonuclease [Aestuariibacter sp.]|nr:RusA family crossover junction endodeoxyribonuclease [Aestuariibacter sp.]